MRSHLPLVLALLSAVLACGRPPEIDVEAEKGAVRATWDEISDAFMAKDWERYYPHFVDGPDFQLAHPGQNSWISGSDEFRRQYESLVRGEGDWRFQTTRFDVRIGPRGDVAWAMAEVVLSTTGSRPSTNWELVVFEKQGAVWKIASALASGVSN